MKKFIGLLLAVAITSSAFGFYKNFKNNTPETMTFNLKTKKGYEHDIKVPSKAVRGLAWDSTKEGDAETISARSAGGFSSATSNVSIITGHDQLKICTDGTFLNSFDQICEEDLK